ncbi:TolC family protein [Limibacter armeniacum]|uniref:TolC family protein n=1 Tax=Limibacter armeniacum TaxID=466084 RepID=UPI002FE56DC7
MKRRSLLLLILGLYATSVWAQDSERRILVEKALVNSHKVAIQQHKVEEAKLDKEKAWLTYMPKVGVTSAYIRLGNEPTIHADISDYTKGIGQAAEGLGSGFQQYLQQTAQANAANGDLALAGALQNPGTQALLGATQQYLGQALSSIPSELTLALAENNLWFYDVHAEMVIFSGMKVPTMAKAAQEKMMAQSALVEREEQVVILETLDYYDRMAVVEQSIKVLDKSQERLDKQTKFANKAMEAGLATDFDLNKIRIAEQELKAKRIELNASRELLFSKLQQLTGMERSELDSLSPELNIWWVSVEEANTANRAELKALDHSIQALQHKHKAEELDILPKAKAFAHLMQGGSDNIDIDPTWFVGVGMKWEIFDGLQRNRDVQKSQLEVESMVERRKEAEELIALDYEKKYMEWQVATQLVEVAKEKAKNAEQAMKIRVREHENGLVGINDRLEASSDYEKAELDYIQALHRQRKAAADFLQAMGTLDVTHIQ